MPNNHIQRLRLRRPLNLVNIPKNYRVIANIGLGYPDEKPSPKKVKSFKEAIIKGGLKFSFKRPDQDVVASTFIFMRSQAQEKRDLISLHFPLAALYTVALMVL